LIIVLDGLERAVSRGKHVTACDVRQRCRKGPNWAEGYVLAETWSQPADEAHREERERLASTGCLPHHAVDIEPVSGRILRNSGIF